MGSRRSVLETAEGRAAYRESFEEGKAAAAAVHGHCLDHLRDDLPDIIELIEYGQRVEALEAAGNALSMSPEELFGILPHQSGPGLAGYLKGLLDRYERVSAEMRPKKRRRAYYG